MKIKLLFIKFFTTNEDMPQGEAFWLLQIPHAFHRLVGKQVLDKAMTVGHSVGRTAYSTENQQE